ncbi:hypothetical protein HYW75_06085 [Candidatus Pacearchaeota archaeon]|nr:hypothetical protein [Candidatus Pacearchaeota archaeon]
MSLYLETLSLEGNSDLLTSGLLGAILAFLAIIFIFAVIIYIYLGFAFMAIGKRARLSAPGLSWIPFVGPAIIAYRASKMHWWPWLLIIGMFIPWVGPIFSIAFAVYVVIWQWKMFEVIERPGWWALLCLIPIVNLILYGIAAWGNPKN